MALLHRQLDVLGIMVAAADDQQVLEPAGDEAARPSWTNPRSPVRRKGPSPASASRAWKVGLSPRVGSSTPRQRWGL